MSDYTINPDTFTGFVHRGSIPSIKEKYFYSFPADPRPPIGYSILDKSSLSIQIALAGFTTDQLSIYTEGYTLVVKGDNRSYRHLSERFRLEFTSRFEVNSNRLDIDDIRYELAAGVLSIVIGIKDFLNIEKVYLLNGEGE